MALVTNDDAKKENEAGANEKKLAAKREAAKKFKMRRAEESKKRYENACKLRDELTRVGAMDKLSLDSKTFVADLCKTLAERQAEGNTASKFTLIYGNAAKVGDFVTLAQVFDKTGQGQKSMDKWVKLWAEKGITVELTVDQNKFSNSKYTVKSLATK